MGDFYITLESLFPGDPHLYSVYVTELTRCIFRLVVLYGCYSQVHRDTLKYLKFLRKLVLHKVHNRSVLEDKEVDG